MDYDIDTIENIRKICEANEKGELEINFLYDWFWKWKYLTRLLINNGKYGLLYVELERIMEEVANNQNTDAKIPVYKPKVFKKNTYRDALNKQIKITEVAEKYGLKVERNKCVCPFHGDTDPSLGLSDEKGVFHCFGCGVKGDTLKFIQMLEGLYGNERGS